jgi:hypothetical protein
VSLSASCLFLRSAGSSHLKMSAADQSANIKFCILLYKSPSEILGMLEEAHGKTAMKKTRVYGWYKCEKRVSMTIRSTGDRRRVMLWV